MKKINKKKVITLGSIIALLIVGPIISLAETTYEIPNKAFKDEKFYKCIIDSYNQLDSGGTQLTINDNITDAQLSSIDTLNCGSYGVKDIVGIEKLTNVEWVILSNNELTNIDLSANKKITSLSIAQNNLKTIDLSALTELDTLKVGYNMLKEIDLSKNSKLTTLFAEENQFKSIDLAKNTLLTYIDLSGNRISNIDLNANVNLEGIDLGYNLIESINLSALTKLKALKLDDNHISSIDVSSNTALESLDLFGNALKTIDLENVFNLQNLNISYNMIEEVNLSDQNKLDVLDISYNPVKNLTVDDYRLVVFDKTQYYQTEFKVNKLNIGNSSIDMTSSPYELYWNEKININEKVNVSDFVSKLGLRGIVAEIYNGTTEVTSGEVKDGYTLKLLYNGQILQELPIDVLINPYFKDKQFYKYVVEGYNEINNTSLTVNDTLTKDQLATIVNVYRPMLNDDKETVPIKIGNTVGIEYLTNLEFLSINDNLVSDINLTKNSKLQYLSLSSNKLKNIDLSANTSLIDLSLDENYLEQIDLSKQNKLMGLSIRLNNLKEINIANMKQLEMLKLNFNHIKSINLKGNPALGELGIAYNLLSDIDLSNNSALTYLAINCNNIDNLDLSANRYIESFGYGADYGFNGNMILLGDTTKVNAVRYLSDATYYSNYAIRNGVKLEPKEYLKSKDYIRFASYDKISDDLKIENYNEVIIYIKGDITGDGLLKINDISKLYQSLKGKVELTDEEFFVADFNKDGEIKINDVAKAYQKLKGKINSL